jgi:hypothetical protein
MPHFGWTRLAYLLFVLVVLTALVQLASLRPDPRPLSSEPSDGVATAAPRTTDEEPREPAKTTPPAAPLPAALPASVSDRLEDMATDVPTVGSPYTRAPVFRRPAPATPPAGSGGVAVRTPAFGSGPVCGDLENFPSTSKIVFSRSGTFTPTRTPGGRPGRRVATRGPT